MESRLLKIRMVSDSRARLDSLIQYMREHIDQPRSEMTQKGYFWDSVFWESGPDADYLYIVLKSQDFTRIMSDDAELIATPFRAVYDRFRATSWTSEPYVEMEPIFCFNDTMRFSGASGDNR